MVFRTARAKEYPSALCGVLARALVDAQRWRAPLPGASPIPLPGDVAEYAAEIRRHERSSGEVSMGADFAHSHDSANAWVPQSAHAPPPGWMPEYPLPQAYGPLAWPPISGHWDYVTDQHPAWQHVPQPPPDGSFAAARNAALAIPASLQAGPAAAPPAHLRPRILPRQPPDARRKLYWDSATGLFASAERARD